MRLIIPVPQTQRGIIRILEEQLKCKGLNVAVTIYNRRLAPMARGGVLSGICIGIEVIVPSVNPSHFIHESVISFKSIAYGDHATWTCHIG